MKRAAVGIVTASGFGASAVFGIWKITQVGGSTEAFVGIALSMFGIVLGILIATGHQT